MKKLINKKEGFTLIEILVVIGIIAILAGIVLVAINPARQFAQANNTQRNSNVNAILNAIGQYIADNKGGLPAGMPVAGAAAEEINAALCGALVPTYISALPTDPDSTKEGESITACADAVAGAVEYKVFLETAANGGRITVSAPDTQIPPADAVISVTR